MNNRIRSAFTFAALTLIVLFWFGCSRNVEYQQLQDLYDRPPLLQGEPDFYRDSSLIAFAVQKRRESLNQAFIDQHPTGKPLPDKLVDDVEVVDILYGPEKLQLVGLVTYKTVRSHLSADFDRRPAYYAGEAVAGIRNSAESTWEIYPIDVTSIFDFKESGKAGIALRIQYFEFLTGNKSMNVGYPLVTGSKPIYNVDDPRFWDSVLWQKGARLPNLFPFQVKQGMSNRDATWIPINPYVEKYPAWIEELYRKR